MSHRGMIPHSRWRRIVMVEFASTQTRVKGVVPSTNCEGSHTEATAVEPLNASPPPTTDEANKLYHQLVENIDIIIVQLAE
jgi:hypothetical protein